MNIRSLEPNGVVALGSSRAANAPEAIARQSGPPAIHAIFAVTGILPKPRQQMGDEHYAPPRAARQWSTARGASSRPASTPPPAAPAPAKVPALAESDAVRAASLCRPALRANAQRARPAIPAGLPRAA